MKKTKAPKPVQTKKQVSYRLPIRLINRMQTMIKAYRPTYSSEAHFVTVALDLHIGRLEKNWRKK